MDAPRWLDEDEQAAWRGFLEVSNRVERYLEAQLKDAAGLSHPQFEILVRLADAPDRSLRMTELTEALLTFKLTSKSGLTYHIARLEKRGLVVRRSCPTDVRGVLAVLTDDGLCALQGAAPGHVAAVRAALIDVLEEDELAVLAGAFGRIGHRLRAPYGT